MDSKIENFIKKFLDYPNETNACNLTKKLRCSNLHNINILVGKYLINIYPYNIEIRSETAISAYYACKYELSYQLYSINLEYKSLNEKESNLLIFNRHFSSNHIAYNYINYNTSIIQKIIQKPINHIPLVTFTITTCKRFNLFEKTMNSFLNCCKDINKIDHWICVDDNSSQEDKDKMQEKYPFFIFYWKSTQEKGHPQSMNIIRNLVKTPFIFHMEDDWMFFERKNYISECMEVLSSNNNIGQCLINKNYAETIDDINIVGGLFNKTNTGLRFFAHEYTPDKKSQSDFDIKYNFKRNCSYWPHFSFRPSLLKKDVLNIIGKYNELISHFEMDYANRYVKYGFISTFLESIYCIHIGRLTSERNDESKLNAYKLNDEIQFCDKKSIIEDQNLKKPLEQLSYNNIKTYLINLDTRSDRLNLFDNISPISYTRFPAINGKKLKPNKHLQQIFEGNDYNMRVGLVGCAMSHLKLLIDLVNSDDSINTFFIMEDDITFVPNFIEKFESVIIKSTNIDWDLIYLGHHLYENHKTNSSYDKKSNIILEKWSTSLSLIKSLGGFFGYLINKKGAKKLLDFINLTGMTNGIDTIQQKSISKANINTYYCFPHLIYSQYVSSNTFTDSDIQYNFDSVSLNKEDLESLNGQTSIDRLKKDGKFNIDDALVYND